MRSKVKKGKHSVNPYFSKVANGATLRRPACDECKRIGNIGVTFRFFLKNQATASKMLTVLYRKIRVNRMFTKKVPFLKAMYRIKNKLCRSDTVTYPLVDH